MCPSLLENKLGFDFADLYPSDGDPDLPRNNVWPQKDVAPHNFQLAVQNHLNELFYNR